MDFLENFKYILNKRIKEDKIITQKQLAEKLNVSPVAVNKWLNGGLIDYNKIPALCEAINVTPNELFGFEDNSEDREILDLVNKNPNLKTYILSTKKD